jgi:hypothetical protein
MLKYSSQLCLLLLMSILCFAMLMDRLNGRLWNLGSWVRDLKFDIYPGGKPRWLELYLMVITGCLLVLPLVTIVLWAIMLWSHGDNRAAWSVVLLGFAIWMGTFGFLKIKWNNWRFKKQHRFIMLAAYLSWTAWQFVIVFVDSGNSNTYTGLSGIFLTQNGVCATFFLFVNIKAKKFTMKSIFETYLYPNIDSKAKDPNRDLKQEVAAQQKDETWFPSINEVLQYVSIGKVSDDKQASAMGAGLQTWMQEQPPGVRFITNIVLLCLYGGLFAAYSLIDYYTNNHSSLGLITSVTVIIVDVFIVGMFFARIIKQPAFLSFLLFATRILIFAFG